MYIDCVYIYIYVYILYISYIYVVCIVYIFSIYIYIYIYVVFMTSLYMCYANCLVHAGQSVCHEPIFVLINICTLLA